MAIIALISRFSVLLGLLLFSDTAFGRIVPRRDARAGILDAALVVIVSQRTSDDYRIEEVFLGDVKPGDSLHLPGFQLFTRQEHGLLVVEPISSATRILLFLQRKELDPKGWEPTDYGYCFFWVHEPGRVFQLRSIAQEAVGLRRRWEEAAGISDPRKRVEALWPFLRLMEYGPRFFERTKSELQHTGQVAGDYLAEQFDSMPRLNRSLLYHEAGLYGGPKLHQTLISHISGQQRLYEVFLAKHGLNGKAVIENWNTIPDEVKDVYGEVNYGLAGVASFRDPNDLPLIREVALWAVKYGLEQTCESALAAFQNTPEKGNLPIIQAIWKEFGPPQIEGMAGVRYDLIRSLCAHRFPETVPLLAEFVTDPFAGREVTEALSEIVGEDLGRDTKAWLEWYATQHSSE